MRRIAIFLIRGYQLLLSPLLGNHCRFDPTCSSYAIQAIRDHGTLRGGWLAARRIGRCHPWGGHGYDPVPPEASSAETFRGTHG
ncbi:membrane protein insertion efficiency factor YidD [Wenzhouxiangella sp. XN24]|uniref:membrane protein insertion efficiency factor YidD n=1 Tax=Wenzhouxiangella sp. XN24 TaxID=2713569 RepID=UPI0013EC7221|nr:membrane protein insertion efficiency factor YidD [Wenzhouxiangella sp. XN24]NGX17524.1 membrane protein insertion efficiency factor YidD [Wenzhouxiangella sp. XN24]